MHVLAGVRYHHAVAVPVLELPARTMCVNTGTACKNTGTTRALQGPPASIMLQVPPHSLQNLATQLQNYRSSFNASPFR